MRFACIVSIRDEDGTIRLELRKGRVGRGEVLNSVVVGKEGEAIPTQDLESKFADLKAHANAQGYDTVYYREAGSGGPLMDMVRAIWGGD